MKTCVRDTFVCGLQRKLIVTCNKTTEIQNLLKYTQLTYSFVPNNGPASNNRRAAKF